MIRKLLFIISIVSLCGCGTTHRYKAYQINSYMNEGNYHAVVSKTAGTSKVEKSEPEGTKLLDSLNSGKALFITNNYQHSVKMFDNADTLIDNHYKELITTTAAKEAIININNASVLDYQPMVLDEIYLSSYKILACLAMEDKAGARIEANKAYSKQQNASEYFSREIEKANEEAKSEISSIDAKNQKLWKKNQEETINKYFSDLDKWQGYKNYMNPYSTYLSGLYFMLHAESRSDFETASTYMKRVAGMMPDNSFIRSDLKQAENSSNYNSFCKDNHVWIIYENGMVADFEELRIDVPAFIVTNTITFVSFAMPRPKVRDGAFPYLYATLDGKEKVRTEILTDVDSIFIAEFKRKLPIIMTRAVAQTITKTTMQYAAYKNEDQAWARILVAAYTLATSSADLRSWHTLPKNVQLAKLKIKDSDTLSISIDGGINIEEIKIPRDRNSIVYIRIPSIMSKPAISVIQI